MATAKRSRVKPDQETALIAETGSVTGETVTVACKLPHGLDLRLFEMVPTPEPIMGGGSRIVDQARPMPKIVKLNGFANPVNAAPKSLTYGGYGMTYNVDKEFFERWLEQNADSDIVQKELIFALESHEDAHEMAHDQKDVVSGLEAVDPTKVIRIGMFGVSAATPSE